MTAKSRLCASSLSIVHIILKGILPEGMPARMVHQQMQGFVPSDHLRYFEIEFDIGSAKGIKDYEKMIKKVAEELLLYVNWNTIPSFKFWYARII